MKLQVNEKRARRKIIMQTLRRETKQILEWGKNYQHEHDIPSGVGLQVLTTHPNTTADTRIKSLTLVHRRVETKYAYCSFNCTILQCIIVY